MDLLRNISRGCCSWLDSLTGGWEKPAEQCFEAPLWLSGGVSTLRVSSLISVFLVLLPYLASVPYAVCALSFADMEAVDPREWLSLNAHVRPFRDALKIAKNWMANRSPCQTRTDLGFLMFSVKMLHEYEQIIRKVWDFLHYTQALIDWHVRKLKNINSTNSNTAEHKQVWHFTCIFCKIITLFLYSLITLWLSFKLLPC